MTKVVGSGMPRLVGAALMLSTGAAYADIGTSIHKMFSLPEDMSHLKPTAVAMFCVFVLISLSITWWAAKRTKSTADFFTAGGKIGGFQNGLAITGDWCSSAALMGIAALLYSYGFDGLIYSVVPFGAWPRMMFLLAERLRNPALCTGPHSHPNRQCQPSFRGGLSHRANGGRGHTHF